LWQVQAQQNIETFKKYGVRKVIASCPHCFNTIANEYPQLGGSYEVVHALQLVDRLIAEGKLKVGRGMAEAVAYHDPCYLGRHNGRAGADPPGGRSGARRGEARELVDLKDGNRS